MYSHQRMDEEKSQSDERAILSASESKPDISLLECMYTPIYTFQNIVGAKKVVKMKNNYLMLEQRSVYNVNHQQAASNSFSYAKKNTSMDNTQTQ